MSGFWWHRGWSPLGGGGPCGEQQPTFKVLCRAFEGRCLAVRDDAFVLAPADRAEAPALVQGHARQPAGQGQGGQARLLPRQQGHWASRPALPRPEPSGNPTPPPGITRSDLPFLLLCTALTVLCEILDL